MEPEPPRSRLWRGDIISVATSADALNVNRNGNLPLQRIIRRPSSISPARLFGGVLLAAALGIGALPALAESGPFAALTGAWGGNGTIQPGNGATERIRCNADYRPRGSSGQEIDLDLRCASDSYNFDLTGQFSADGNRVSGQWTERTRNIGGSAIGTAQGERLQVHVESAGFAANLSMVTHGRRQSVTIDSHGGGQVVKASIALSRR
jgi:hypothetical protein